MNATPVNKSSEQLANEPSMEEILASIRRIIADDKMLPLTPKSSADPLAGPLDEFQFSKELDVPLSSAERSPASYEGPSLRVLQGGLPKVEPPLASSTPETIEALAPELSSQKPERVAAKPETSFDRAAEALEAQLSQEPLISPKADASIASSFQTLATSVFLQNTGMVEQTLRDLLRPMLKQWLDQNLPPIVERLVRSEIERVARGGR